MVHGSLLADGLFSVRVHADCGYNTNRDFNASRHSACYRGSNTNLCAKAHRRIVAHRRAHANRSPWRCFHAAANGYVCINN